MKISKIKIITIQTDVADDRILIGFVMTFPFHIDCDIASMFFNMETIFSQDLQMYRQKKPNIWGFPPEWLLHMSINH